MAAVTFTFGGTSSTTVAGLIVADVVRPMMGSRRDVYKEIPGREGSWPFYESPGDREIVVTFRVATSDSGALRTAVAALGVILSQSGRRELIFSDQSDRFWLCRVSDMSPPKEQRGYAEFDVSFRSDPYAYSTSLSTQVLGPTSTQPYTTSFAVTTDADTGYQLDIAPTGSALTSGFVMTVNSSALTYGTTVAAGQVASITWTGKSLTLTNNGTLSMATVSGVIGSLISGTNNITFSRASGTASTTLTFNWRRRYV